MSALQRCFFRHFLIGVLSTSAVSAKWHRSHSVRFVLSSLPGALASNSSARLLSCFPPLGEIPVHQRMEVRIVTGLQEVAQFMDHHVLHTPLRQEQQIRGEADSAALHVAYAPPRHHRLECHSRGAHAHHPGMCHYQRLHHCPESLRSLCPLCRCSQRQLVIEGSALTLSLRGSEPGPGNPRLMLAYKILHLTPRHTDRSRHMHIAILHNAHGQPAGPPVCHLYSHLVSRCKGNTFP